MGVWSMRAREAITHLSMSCLRGLLPGQQTRRQQQRAPTRSTSVSRPPTTPPTRVCSARASLTLTSTLCSWWPCLLSRLSTYSLVSERSAAAILRVER